MTAEEEEWVEREPAWCISLGNGLSVQHTPEAEAHWQAVVDEDALADATDPRFTDGQRAPVSLDDLEFTPLSAPPAWPGKPGTKPSRAIERADFEVDDNGCYVWTGRLVNGYGTLGLYGTRHLAHRAIWLDSVGQIGDGLHLDHLCRNRACINPDHMEVVTPRENALRGMSPFAELARRTHCDKGHEWTLESTRWDRGARFCGTCKPRRVPESERPHGTTPRWRSGCRCDECRQASHEDYRARRRREGKQPRPAPEQRHGTRPRYRAGCRCQPCSTANSVYRRELQGRASNAGAE